MQLVRKMLMVGIKLIYGKCATISPLLWTLRTWFFEREDNIMNPIKWAKLDRPPAILVILCCILVDKLF